jgi:hypothetical protein
VGGLEIIIAHIFVYTRIFNFDPSVSKHKNTNVPLILKMCGGIFFVLGKHTVGHYLRSFEEASKYVVEMTAAHLKYKWLNNVLLYFLKSLSKKC